MYINISYFNLFGDNQLESDIESLPNHPIWRNIITILIITFLFGFASTTYSTVLQPLILLETGNSLTFMGFILSVAALVDALGHLISGSISDLFGRKLPLALGGIFFALCGYIILISGLIPLIIGIILGTIAFDLSGSPGQAAISESVPTNMTSQSLSWNVAASTAPLIIAPLLIPLIFTNDLIRAPLSLFPILGISILFMVIVFMKETKRKSHDIQNISHFKLPKFSKPLKLLYAYNILDAFSFGIGFGIFFGLLIDFNIIRPDDVWLLTLVQGIFLTVFQFPAGRIADKSYKTSLMIAADALALSSLLILILYPSFITAIIVSILGATSSGLWISPLMSLIVKFSDETERSLALGSTWSIRRFVSIPSPIIGTSLATLFGFYAPLLTNILLGLFLFPILVKVRNEEKAF